MSSMLENKKVLVTGAGGFIGSHLCDKLIEEGCKVRAFVKYNSRSSWGWIEESRYKDKMEVVLGDIRNYDSVKAAVKGRDVIFHLAALIGIPYSYITPESYVDTNINGTLNMLEAARAYGVDKIIHTSTSEVYGTARHVPMTEEHPVSPQSPYAATKAAADYLVSSFHKSFALPASIIRPFNTYGPRQSARAVIPAIIIQILSGAKSIKLGSLYPTRDFTYVKDTVDALVLAAKSGKCNAEVVNIGSGLDVSVKELVSMIAGIMGAYVKIDSDEIRKRPPNSEVERLRADNKKARKILKWSPAYSLEEGLRQTISWIKDNLTIYKTGRYNV